MVFFNKRFKPYIGSPILKKEPMKTNSDTIKAALGIAQRTGNKQFVGPNGEISSEIPDRSKLCYEIYPGGRIVEWMKP